MGARPMCAVDPQREAPVDAAHRIQVNQELYYVADEAAKARFLAEPHLYTGPLTDPVTLKRFQPGASSPRRTFGGRLFYLESEETAARFDADPRTYGTPR